MNKIKLRPTHLEVLTHLKKHSPPSLLHTAIEFGSGEYSTKWFLDNNYHLTTVEYDLEWAFHVCMEFKDHPFFTKQYVVRMPFKRMHLPLQLSDDQLTQAETAIMNFVEQYLDEKPDMYTICFVDCFAATRQFVIEAMKDRCHIMVVHDTEDADSYGMYDALMRAKEWFSYCKEFKHVKPHTTVFSDFELPEIGG